MKKSSPNLDAMRHSAAHLMAAAVQKLWPETKFGIGPAIENGFYYDFKLPVKLTEKDLVKIEKKMEELKGQDFPIEQLELPIDEALEKAKKESQNFKLELIEQIRQTGDTRIDHEARPSEKRKKKAKVTKVSFYKLGDFFDLCRGPHVSSTGQIGHFKLLNIAGAYWRGSEKNPMLTRIYGTVWPTKKELKKHLALLKETQQRDHRKLGKQLGIYMFSDLVGPGLPLYMPNGAVIVEEIEKFMKQLQTEAGYQHVYTPHIAKDELFKTSGHLQWFKEGMYPPMEFEGEGNYYAKPMNCPFHIEIYKSAPRSYRDLPIRYAEFGTVYRYEKSGEIAGFVRTRGFTQDDAHIFCRPDQVVDEFIGVFELTDTLLGGLGFKDYWHRLSLRGKEKGKYAGNEAQWEKATSLIRKALKKKNIDYKEVEGEATFYGPKLDIMFKDALEREWQVSTIQVDFLLPERFRLTYADKDGVKKRPFMIHRTPLGSRERIITMLLEHYAGALPVWLSPVQAVILPITDRNAKYAQKVARELKGENIRTVLNDRPETLQAKIRDAQLQKVPYMLVIGDKEEKGNKVSLRLRTGENLGSTTLDIAIKRIKEAIGSKSLKL